MEKEEEEVEVTLRRRQNESDTHGDKKREEMEELERGC